MKKTSVALCLSAILLQSCASILNPKYQKVVIEKSEEDKILIDNKEPMMKNGKYKLRRDRIAKQITLVSDGYQDQNIVVMQQHLSPLYIMSWIPFGAVYLLPPLLDLGPKATNYSRAPIVFDKKIPDLEQKPNDAKNIQIKEVAIDIDKEDATFNFYRSYKKFLKGKKSSSGDIKTEEDKIQINDTKFSYALNELLVDKGYIDTTDALFKNSYTNNLLINSKLTHYTTNFVQSKDPLSGMIFVKLKMNWEVLDYYGKPIHKMTTENQSGQYAVYLYGEKTKTQPEEAIYKSVKDAIEKGFIEFMASEKTQELLYDKSMQEEEQNFSVIKLETDGSHVNSISQSVKSSLTIKTKDGFGSGFIISNDGHIITNYHVVTDTADLEVVFSDGDKFTPEIVRISRINDLALLKIDLGGKKVNPFKISNSKEIEIASEIYAVGTPSAKDLSQTVSKGIISGVRDYNNSKLIQTDASINSGNSGGPLVNKEGEVVGVVSSKLKGFGVEGVAFCIPSYEIYDKLKLSFE